MRMFCVFMFFAALSGCAHLNGETSFASLDNPPIHVDNDAEFLCEGCCTRLVEVPFTTMPRPDESYEFCFDFGVEGMEVYSSLDYHLVVVYTEDDYCEVAFTKRGRLRKNDSIFVVTTTAMEEAKGFFEKANRFHITSQNPG